MRNLYGRTRKMAEVMKTAKTRICDRVEEVNFAFESEINDYV